MTAVSHLLKIGGLPSLRELALAHQAGYDCLINVSGVDLQAFFPAELLEPFTLSQYIFSDIFSRLGKIDGQFKFNDINVDAYTALAIPADREQFFLAAQCLAMSLAAGHRTYLFCHRGQGRSPVVAGAAMAMLSAGLDYKELYQSLINIHPQAHLSPISFAAITWCKAQTGYAI